MRSAGNAQGETTFTDGDASGPEGRESATGHGDAPKEVSAICASCYPPADPRGCTTSSGCGALDICLKCGNEAFAEQAGQAAPRALLGVPRPVGANFVPKEARAGAGAGPGLGPGKT